MNSGREISAEFIREVIWPLLRDKLKDDAQRVAIAVIGTGSDVQGWDDSVSRDHHWGPRANILLLDADAARLRPVINQVMLESLPWEYQGFKVNYGLTVMAGVCCTTLCEFFSYFLGSDQLPQSEVDWLSLCEVDLLHVTGGEVIVDGPGEMTIRRKYLHYYPDNVWKKKIADWCMYITGRDAPYNLHRMAKRNDGLTGSIYKALYLKQVMELCFTLNRRYAPYTKWLNAKFRELPKYVGGLAPVVDRIYHEPDLKKCVHLMIEGNQLIAEAIADLGIARLPEPRKFDDKLTDLSLYESAAQIYAQLPPELLHPSFNRVELWEKLARDVLFDSDDYFLSEYKRKKS